MTKDTLREEWEKEFEARFYAGEFGCKKWKTGHKNTDGSDILEIDPHITSSTIRNLKSFISNLLTQALAERDEELRVKINELNDSYKADYRMTAYGNPEERVAHNNKIFGKTLAAYDVLSLLKDKDI